MKGAVTILSASLNEVRKNCRSIDKFLSLSVIKASQEHEFQ